MVVERAESARNGAGFHLTPLLLTTVVFAVVATVVLAVMWSVDADTPPPPPPGRIPPPPPTHAGLNLAVAVFAVAWVAVIVAACRDQVLRRIDQMSDRLAAASIRFAEEREEDGYFRGARDHKGADVPRQAPPPPSGG